MTALLRKCDIQPHKSCQGSILYVLKIVSNVICMGLYKNNSRHYEFMLKWDAQLLC